MIDESMNDMISKGITDWKLVDGKWEIVSKVKLVKSLSCDDESCDILGCDGKLCKVCKWR